MNKELKERKEHALDSAVKVALELGYASFRQSDVATKAGCAKGNITNYFGTMTKLRRAVMRRAVRDEILPIIAQGLGMSDPIAMKADTELKRKALQELI